MAYTATSDPYAFNSHSLEIPKKKLLAVVAASTDLNTYSLIYASASGSITYIPALNADVATVTETVLQGWVSPVLVRQVTAATATVWQILD